MRGAPPGCGHIGPNLVASRSPSHDGSRAGGAQRNAPTGADTYGMPLKVRTSSFASPTNTPVSILTLVGSALMAYAHTHWQMNAMAAQQPVGFRMRALPFICTGQPSDAGWDKKVA